MKKIIYWYRCFYNGVANLILFHRVIWRFRGWDYTFTEDLLYIALNRHLVVLELDRKNLLDGYTTDTTENEVSDDIFTPNPEYKLDEIKALKLAIKILDRRKSIWYTNAWYKNYENNKDKDYRDRQSMDFDNVETRDWRIFCNILNKYFNYWWT